MKKSYAAFFVLAVVIAVSMFRLGSVTLFDVDEAVFAEATKEMVHSGDYITPTYNGDIRYDKPILIYWLMALSYKTFGINEFGARFPSALAGIMLAMALYYFIRHFFDNNRALYASLSMTVSLYFFVYSRASVTDMVLTLFITLSLFSFYLSIKRNSHFIYGFYLFSALAFLTKGLIGIVFPFVIAGIFLLVTEGFGGLKRAFNLKALLLFLIVGVPWYAAQFAINGDEFFQQFFMKHHFKRYTGVISGHKGPVYYYLAALLIGMFPWVAFLPSGIRRAIKERDQLQIFALIWFAFIFLFFSFATTKLPDYILSAIPASAILISAGLMEQGVSWKRWAWGGIAFISLAIGAAFIIAPTYLVKFGITDSGWMILAAATAFAMAGISIYSVFASRPSFAGLLCIALVFLAILLVKALPVANEQLQGSLYRFSIYAKDRLPDDERIIAYGINFPSIVFYSGHRVAIVRGSEALQQYVREKGGRLAIAKSKDMDVLTAAGFTPLQKDERFALFERK